MGDYSYLKGFDHAVDWCYECLDRERRGFEDAVVHNHASVKRQIRYLYILKLDGGIFYTGQTNALELRLQEHRDGQTKSTAGKNPRLVWFEQWEGNQPELPISSCLGPSNAPSSTRAIVVSVTDAVNHPIKLTEPSLGVVS